MCLKNNINYKKIFFASLVGLSVVLLIGLGIWQLKRLKYKNNVLQAIHINTELEPISHTQLEQIEQNILQRNLYRKVKLSGNFLHNKEIFIYAGGRYSNYPEGYLLFTPLIMAEKKIVMINRGFIPTNLKNKNTRLSMISDNTVNIEGYLMKGEGKNWAIPKNDLNKNIWFSIDLEQMQQYVGLNLEQYFISQIYQNEDYPIGERLNINIRNNHFAYAITWFGLAFALSIIYYLFHKKYV